MGISMSKSNTKKPTRSDLLQAVIELEKSIEAFKDDEKLYALLKENLRKIRNILYI